MGLDDANVRPEGISDADIRSHLDAHGLAIAEPDSTWWLLSSAAEIAAVIPGSVDSEEVFAPGQADLSAYRRVSARSMNAVDIFGGQRTIDDDGATFPRRAIVGMNTICWCRSSSCCGRASQRSRTARNIVRRADRPIDGIAVDAWHILRNGADEKLLRSVPGDCALGIQFDDGPGLAEANLLDATLRPPPPGRG